ncbi:amino acid adenylation domain-containing protein [Gordonia sp. ABSL1-1]|uniref:non-ribosomal peptide synthetase n=1 Tax=Gordonia sp. ABSL1-1 TaxID=3053923 RepID=UPI002573DF39|nr:non-ribosomal peptide synthetase [Gordonia sp. ABSL1-1]MDL9935870.1 amino acid adenylation domain-containing protein [Gordonia sp. ABSL1-1]
MTTTPATSEDATVVADEPVILPALAGQRDIFLGMQVTDEPTLYNTGMYLEYSSSVGIDRARAVTQRLITEAESLRTVFTVTDGELRQRILPPDQTPVTEVDLREGDAQAWMDEDMSVPMDIETGPLARFVVLRVSESTNYFYVKVHHLVCDGMGLVHVVSAMRAWLTGATGTRDWTMAGVVAAEETYRAGPEFVTDRDYWVERMADKPPPARLLDDDLPPGRGCVHARFEIPDDELAPLRELASAAGVRPTVLLIAATLGFTRNRTGHEDLVVALPVTGRLDRATRTTPSMVTSVLPLRVGVHGRDTIADVAVRTDRALYGLLAHSRFRGEDLGRALADRSGAEPTGSYRMFGLGVNVIASTLEPTLDGRPARAHALASGPVSDVEIQIQLRRKGQPAEVVVRGVAEAGAAAREIADAFATFLGELAGTPDARLDDLEDRAVSAPHDDTHGPLAPPPALQRLRAAGVEPGQLEPATVAVTAPPGTTAATITEILDSLVERHGALRTVLDRSLPFLWTLHTDPPGGRGHDIPVVEATTGGTHGIPGYPRADFDTGTGELTLRLDPVLIDPRSTTILGGDLSRALADHAAGRAVTIDPVPVSLHAVMARLGAQAAQVAALDRWLALLAPATVLPTGAEQADGVVRRRRPVSRDVVDHAALAPIVAATVATALNLTGELLIDVAIELRDDDGIRTVGPLQGLRPVRVDLVESQLSAPVPGPALDTLRELAPTVATALAAARARGDIADPDILVGDYGLPTAHALRVKVIPGAYGSVVAIEIDPCRVADANRVADELLDALVAHLEDRLVSVDDDTLAELARTAGVRPDSVADIWPLTALQEGLYYQAQVDADADIYTAQFWLDFGHRVDADRLQVAARTLLADNPELRAAFGEHDGRPCQLIIEDVEPDLTVLDLSGGDTAALEAALTADRSRPIPLDRAPLWRLTLIRLADGIDRLVVNRRFILWDGWSGGLFVTRLLAHLHGTEVPAREASLRDYLTWFARTDHAAALDRWRTHLAGYTEPSLVAPRAAGSFPRVPRRIDVDLGPDRSGRLRTDARSAGVTLNTLLSAALTLTLARVLGRTDVAYGSTVAGRPTEIAGLDTVIGMFLNTIPVRTVLRPSETVRELLIRMQGDRVGLMSADHVGLAQLQAATGQSALFDVLYVLQNFRTEEEEQAQSALHDIVGEGSLDHTHYPLALVVTPANSIRFRLEFRDDLVAAETADDIATRFRDMLDAVGSHLDSPVATVDLTTGRDRPLTGPTYPLPSTTVATLLANRAVLSGDDVALVFDDRRMSYAELQAQIDRVAAALAAHGVGAESLVALAIGRNIDMIVAIFAVLRAGGAYLPLELDHPDDRLRAIIEAGTPMLLLTETTVAQRFATDVESSAPPLATGLAVLCIDDLPPVAPGWIAPPVRPDSAAYVIFTSGSTGAPKGVVTPYRGLTNMQLNHREKVFEPAIAVARAAGHQGRMRIAHTVSFAFDMSWEELLWLVEGHEVHICDEDLRRDSVALVDYCARARIDVINVTPTYAAQLIADGLLDGPRVPPLVLLGGEAVGEPVWNRLRTQPDTFGYNLYGPTEYTINTLGIGTDESPTSSVGTPIWNTVAHLLDPWLRPVPAGVAGELYVSGAGLARGYLGRCDLTAERFVADPFSTGGRLYRTGDLMRMGADGNLDFLGRADDQVKIRGHRVELGEIEAALTALPAVAAAAVIATADAVIPDVKRLVAYVIAADSDPTTPSAIDVTAIRTELARTLPDYLVPAQFAAVREFPMTVNGKLDVQALPAPERTGTHRSPVTDLERAVCREVARVLGDDADTEPVGLDDDFFELGGHSMAAMRLVSALRSELGAEIAIRDLFEARTPAQIVARLTLSGTTSDIVVGIRPELVPLSSAQERLWLLHNLDPTDPSYHYGHVVRLQGTVDASALRAAVRDLMQRHEVLRTVIAADADGTGYQEVRDLDDLEPVVEIGRIEALAATGTAVDVDTVLAERSREFLTRPFDLRRQPPIRVRLNQIRADRADHGGGGEIGESVLTIAIHHIATDEWSDRPLLTDLTLAYTARTAGTEPEFTPLPAQYADYALWQRDMLAHRGEEQLQFWTGQLDGLPAEIELPHDRRRRPGPPGPAATVTHTVAASDRDRLAAVAADRGASMFMLVQAAVTVMLHRIGAGDDIPLGTPVSGRTDPALDDLVGFFVATQVLRTDVSGRPRFDELLERVRLADLAAFDHADVPFQQIVEAVAPERISGRNPLFQVSVGYLHVGMVPDRFLGLPAAFIPLAAASAKYDLAFTAVDAAATGEVVLTLEYATDLFDSATAQMLLVLLGRVLTQVSRHPDIRIDRITLLAPDELRAVTDVESGPPAAVETTTTVVDLVRASVAAHPGRDALRDTGGRVMSYADFDARTARLARRLRHHGAGPETVVAVVAERSIEQVIAVHAVLRAGAAYLPVDVDLPVARIAAMITDSGAIAVVTDGTPITGPATVEPAWPITLPVIGFDADSEAVTTVMADDWPQPLPDNAAYVIYTSGSTGEPKGVVVTHRELSNVLSWRRDTMPGGFGPGSAMLVKTPVGFDGAVWELLLPFVSGAAAVVAEPGAHRDPHRQAQIIDEFGVTAAVFVPSLLELFVGQTRALTSLRQLIAGGEALGGDLARRVAEAAPALALINAYGPTETTVVVTDAVATASPEGQSVPIGHPIAGAAVLVLDDSLQRVADGRIGELYVRGTPVARGYLHRPGLTSAAFIADPTGEIPGARCYRTGDLVRRRDGVLEYLGRRDFQVKVRGNRVEIGEVENALSALPGVAGAAVGADADRLVAWVIADGTTGVDVTALTTALARRLPGYMVPSAITVLEHLPLTPAGKLDRRALPMPAARTVEGVRPRTALESDLAEIFSDVLGFEVIDVDADFFALGGHSLLAIKVTNLVRSTLGHELALRTLFDHPSVATLATALADGGGNGAAALPVLDVVTDGPPQLSFGQERMLALHTMSGPAATYNVPLLWRPGGPGGSSAPIDHSALKAAVHDVVMRHEILRTRYRDQLPEVLDAPTVEVVVTDDPAMLSAAGSHAFDLAAEIPIRVVAADGLAVVVIHHIATDEWSAAPLRADLDTAYAARLTGAPPGWAALPVQYSDFAVWQRATVTGVRRETALQFWRDALAGCPAELPLPYDRPRPPRPSGRGDGVFVGLDDELAQRLRAMSARTGTSMFMLMRTAVALLLSRLGGGDDIPLGTPVTVRNDPRLDGLIGFFLNTIVLRTDLSGDPTPTELLTRVRDWDIAALDHRDIPFEQVTEACRSTGTTAMNPLFQTMVVYVDGRLPGPGADAPPAPTTAKFDLSFDFVEDSSHGVPRLGGVIEYSTDLFDRDTVELIARRLVLVLEFITAHPDSPIRHLDVRVDAELETDHRPAAVPTTFPVLLDAAIARDHDAPALRGTDGRRTFGELGRRVATIASRLAGAGIGPEDVVAVCLPRGVLALETIFGVLYSGAAYLPIEPGTPPDRVAAMYEIARPRRIIDALDDPLLAPIPVGAEVPTVTRTRALLPEHPAYVIFTSGSTGTPKGVVVEHRALTNLFAGHRRRLHAPARERTGRDRLRVGHAWSFAFDASWQPQLWLLDGHELSIVDPDTMRDGQALAARLRAEGWDFLEVTPSHLRQLDGAETTMAAIGFGGEAVAEAQWRDLGALTGSDAYNLYGPTEACVDALVARAADSDRPVIGRPVDGARAYVLDSALRSVPAGVDGELYLAGAGLARGYAGRSDLTAERFVPDPFVPDPAVTQSVPNGAVVGARMYRTGDTVRWTRDGLLEYRGRGDDQVKIRGFRVEIGEVEAALADLDGVGEAIVLARNGRLFGYVTGSAAPDAPGLDGAALRTAVRAALPDYMVPAAVAILDELPRLANGKIDRHALPTPTVDRQVRPPVTDTERAVANAIADVVGVPREHVGLDEDFLELGGDSIVAMSLVARLRGEGFAVAPRDVMLHARTADLAAVIDESDTAAVTFEHVSSGPVAALPIVRWLADVTDGDPGSIRGFHQSALLRVPADFDPAVATRALAILTARHHMLRARLVVDDGPWRFDVPETAPTPPIVVEGAVQDDADLAATVLAVAERARGRLDPLAGAMMSATWIPLGDKPGRFLLQVHHLVVDGVSWRTLIPELLSCYAQLNAAPRDARGVPDASVVDLPAISSPYAVWVDAVLADDRRGEESQWRSLLATAGAPNALFDRPLGDHTQGQARRHVVDIDADIVDDLLGAVPAALGASVDDVLLGAFGAAAQTATLVDLEGHGRAEHLRPGIDLTGTVGWFTAVHPVPVGGTASAREQVRMLSAVRADLPDDGFGYGLLRYGTDRHEPVALPSAAIEFNYLGRYRAIEMGDWAMASESVEIGPDAQMPAAYGLVVDVTTLDAGDSASTGPASRMRAVWTYQPGVLDTARVEELATRWLAALRELVTDCAKEAR